MSASENYAKMASYISDNPIATLGTISNDGVPHGAAVYVCPDEEKHMVYFLTKNETQKYIDIQTHGSVSLTIVNPAQNSTLQADGTAFTVRDSHALDMITEKIVAANPESSSWIPPVSKLEAGQYVVVGIKITQARLSEFTGVELDREVTFTEV